MRTEITSTVSNGKRTSKAATPAAYQIGQAADIKFEGMEQTATIVGGPHVRGVTGSSRGYVAWTVSLDEYGCDAIEVAETELF